VVETVVVFLIVAAALVVVVRTLCGAVAGKNQGCASCGESCPLAGQGGAAPNAGLKDEDE